MICIPKLALEIQDISLLALLLSPRLVVDDNNVLYVFLKLGGLAVNFTPEEYFGIAYFFELNC